MKYLMLSCFEATRLIEKKMSPRGITFWENIRLKKHQRLCDPCRVFAEQSAAIETAIQRRIEDREAVETIHEVEPPALPDALKKRILEKLGF